MNLPVSFSITLAPSRWLRFFTIVVYSLSVAVVALLQTTLTSKLALLTIIIISLIWSWRNTHRCTVVRIFPETSEKPWLLVKKTGEQTNAKLIGSQVYRYLVMLYFQLESGNRCTLLIPFDSVDQASHRRLRAQLQQRKAGGRIERVSR
ncbi:MAG TPA: hypothetical protein EYH06_10565 [Chromatiales bacterium]|nr:hypothetical protein [Thiotrichales bacterium]HIP69010.1 hypothetical protein [Chromatiales bacterium]